MTATTHIREKRTASPPPARATSPAPARDMSKPERDSETRTNPPHPAGEAPPFPLIRTPGDGADSSPQAAFSTKLLAVLALIYFAVWAEAVLLPVTVSLLLALTLRPLIRRGRKWGLPEPLVAAVLLAGLVGLGLVGVTRVLEPARHWAESAPAQLHKIEQKLVSLQEQWSVFAQTSAKMKEFAEATGGELPVPVEMHESFWTQHLTLATNTGNALGYCVVVLVLSFFILTAGDHLLNQILAGMDRLSTKKRTVELVREVERGVATYLFTVTMINAGLGIAAGVGFWVLGMPNPALWGALAFLFNYVPFFGPMVCTLIVAFVSVLSFDSLAYACVPPLFFTTLSAVEGNILTPMIVGKSMSLNPIIVFTALITGGWAWGLGGAILAVPLLAVTKIASDKFESTQPLARLLSS